MEGEETSGEGGVCDERLGEEEGGFGGMVGELSDRSGQEICGNAEAEISTFVGVRGGCGMWFAGLRENDGAGGDEIFLAAIREFPGATRLEGYFELFMEVAWADVWGGWACDDFEVVVLGWTLDDHMFR